MILATVRTCPQRWTDYQRLRKQFDGMGFAFPLRTMQCDERLETPGLNSILKARAALSYADRHLPDDGANWMLLLEDDVAPSEALPELLPELVEIVNRSRPETCYGN